MKSLVSRVVMGIGFLALIPVVVLGDESDVAKSVTGAEFTKVSEETLISVGVKDPKKFGEAWKDPSGMIWGDLPQTQDGLFLTLTHIEAESFCKSLGAVLPTGWSEDFNGRHGFPQEDSDFVRLRKYLGAESLKGYSAPQNYQPEILPNLAPPPNEGKHYLLWSSSLRAYRPDLAFMFSSSDGTIFDNSKYYYGFHFRCVVPPSPFTRD